MFKKNKTTEINKQETIPITNNSFFRNFSMGNYHRSQVALILAPGWSVSTPPLSLASLTAYLRWHGFKVMPVDINVGIYQHNKRRFEERWERVTDDFWLKPENIENFINENKKVLDKYVNYIVDSGAKIIGFTIYSNTMNMSLYLAKEIKTRTKDRIIIFGGPEASIYLEGYSFIKNPDVDLVAQGEGEETLLEFAQKVVSDQKITPLAGVLYKEKGKIVSGPDRKLIENLDFLPFPDFSDFDFSMYKNPFVKPISSSRGCPSRCIFCNEKVYWKNYRSRSGESLFEEIKYQLKKHPKVFYFDFQDSLLNGNIMALERFCELIIESGIQIQWSGQAIIRKEMNYDFFLKLKKAGCMNLSYGLETISLSRRERIGKILSKGVDVEKLLENPRRAGIKSMLNFMFGLPGETDEEAEENIIFLKRNARRITEVHPSSTFCSFVPGTPAYENPDKYDIDLKKGALYWESKDGTNNFLKRMSRFERFIATAQNLGIPCVHSSPVYGRKNEVIGNYYFAIGEYQKAIPYFKSAIKENTSNRVCTERLKICHEKISPLHSLTDKLLPLGTKRRFLAKLVFLAIASPKSLFKNLHSRTTNITKLDQMTTDKL